MSFLPISVIQPINPLHDQFTTASFSFCSLCSDCIPLLFWILILFTHLFFTIPYQKLFLFWTPPVLVSKNFCLPSSSRFVELVTFSLDVIPHTCPFSCKFIWVSSKIFHPLKSKVTEIQWFQCELWKFERIWDCENEQFNFWFLNLKS